MSDTIENHLERVIKYIEIQIRDGSSGTNRHHLDGYTLSGLKTKKQILEECLNKLNNR